MFRKKKSELPGFSFTEIDPLTLKHTLVNDYRHREFDFAIFLKKIIFDVW